MLQILAIDLGTETLPALALGREPAEPGADGPPATPAVRRASSTGGSCCGPGCCSAPSPPCWSWAATCSPCGAPAGIPATRPAPGTPLHHAYLQATTITFAGIVACQIGTAFAARTDRASLFSIGLWSNPLLLWGIAFELAFTAAVIYVPWLQEIFGTATLTPAQLVVILPFPFLVWGADELVRLHRRRSARPPETRRTDARDSSAARIGS